jgi:hypothetical protein
MTFASLPKSFQFDLSILDSLTVDSLIDDLTQYHLEEYRPEKYKLESAIALPIDHLLRSLQISNTCESNTCESNTCAIAYPPYDSQQSSPEELERLNLLPLDLQQRYFRGQLHQFLYRVCYLGQFCGLEDFQATEDSQTIIAPVLIEDGGIEPQSRREGLTQIEPATLKNDTDGDINREFYNQLQQHNHGTGYFDPGWQMIGIDDAERTMVQKQGLTLHVESHQMQQAPQVSVSTQASVSIWTPAHRLESGFYLAIGNAGWLYPTLQTADQDILLITFNITCTGAIALLDFLTDALNAIALPFTFKLPYDPDDYQRYEAAQLWINREDGDRVCVLLQDWYQHYPNEFRDGIPLFMYPLAKGVAVGICPQSEAFGHYYIERLTKSLIIAHAMGDESIENRWRRLIESIDSL